MKLTRIAFILPLVVFSFLPVSTHAASATFFGPIVPAECHCDNQTDPNDPTGSKKITTAPDYGCALQVIQNIVNLFISLSIIGFVLFFAYAGLQLIVSRGNPHAIQAAKGRLMNIVIGLAVLLSAWLIVDFVMKTLYDDSGGFGPWNAILAGKADNSDRCIVATKPAGILTGTIGIATGVTPGTDGTPTGAATGASAGKSGLNTQTAIQNITQNAKPTYTGYCARSVCAAVNAGGASMSCANAKDLGPNLKSAGFTALYNGTYSASSGSAFAYQAGDVVVFQGVAGHQYGHTAMYTGSKWVSDTVQNQMASNQADYQGGSFTIYRP